MYCKISKKKQQTFENQRKFILQEYIKITFYYNTGTTRDCFL